MSENDPGFIDVPGEHPLRYEFNDDVKLSRAPGSPHLSRKAARRFIDLKDMPGWNPAVKNGADSISRGVVYVKILWGVPFPYHVKHGALLKVTPEGIWRCPASHEGCWEINE